MNVSIVIPANKDRGWLNQAIESALNQDYTGSYEVILASDGNYSLKKYADRYGIRFSLASKNNLAHNVNVALQMADGEFIKGLAEDDLLAPNCLSDLTRCIGNHDLVYARAFNFKGNPFNYVSLITFVISFAITCFIFAYIIIVVGKDLDNY